jgi:hypothetical protein
MSAAQLTLAAPPHRNQQLFSDYYLNVTLPQRRDWQELVSVARPVMEQIAALFAVYVPSANEAQLEADLIRPILKLLGHTYEVQPALQVPGNAKRPDYMLYPTETAVAANRGKMLTDTLLRGAGAFAVADAKAWERPLDVTLKGRGDVFDNRNPSYQIAFYMQHSGVEWGILTNGRRWRLYHRESAHKLDRFYEVDLPQLIEAGEVHRFLYFYAFFHRSAFEAHALGVAALLRASTDYALGVSETLKAQVFGAIRHLAQGFLDYAQNGLQPDEENLKAIYDNSLIVLYRLLFVLYAEARELLPVRESASYRQTYSLRALTQQIARELQAGSFVLATSGIYWGRLRELFGIIDRGSPPLNVATFNGGLFDPARHPFLEHYAVGDAHLRQAIDTLARVDEQFVDYRDLAEHHLGSIYEGLLEYHLAAIPPEDGWTVAIVNEKGERKTTGSYYTPNFIVKYIVDQTIGPALRAAVADKVSDEQKIAAILRLNVLDPAMGSAYFLVEATEYIARFLVDQALVPADSHGEADLAYWKRRVVQSCIYGVDLNPLAVDLAKLSLWLSTVAKDQPLSFLDHHLRTGNSLVGTRVAEVQGQGSAARQSRKTNARQRQATEAGQLALLDDDAFRRSMSMAVDSMWLIEGSAGATVEEVKEQERVYEELHQTLTRRYARLANLVTATRFGLEIDPTLWTTLADYALGRTISAPHRLIDQVEEADRLAIRQRFFHWDLEFPEVFFDRRGEPLGEQGGFDVVIGNPPYVRQERISPLKPFLQHTFASYQSTADLYLYFYEQGIRVLQQDGRLGYVSSGTFARGNFATAFRRHLPEVARFETVIDFGENQPFKGAEMVRPSIVILQKGGTQDAFRSLFIDGKIPQALDQAIDSHGVVTDPSMLSQPEWVFQSSELSHLANKILSVGTTLGCVVENRVLRGLITGLNEAFAIDDATRTQLIKADARSCEVIKPLVTGQDLRPWYMEDEGRWLILFPCGWTHAEFGADLDETDAWSRVSEQYPAIADFLLPYADTARRRYDKGDYWWELRACDYYKAFEQPKIVWPDIAKLPRFSWDDTATYINNTGYFIPDPHPSLLAILQSRVIWFAVSQISQPLRLRGGLWQYRFFGQFLLRLPIPDLSADDQDQLGSLAMTITDHARQRYALHRAVRNRIHSDLGTMDGTLNQKLTAW